MKTMTYDVDGPIARITLNRPERGNGITLDLPVELKHCVERADLDPSVHVIALSGNGKGFCGGYDLVDSAEGMDQAQFGDGKAPKGSAIDPTTIARNHNPAETWDPMLDYQMMSRNVRGFMSLFNADKPVVCKVHGFCVAGGTDMALCSDLLVMMKLLINQTVQAAGLQPTQIMGTVFDGITRHTKEGYAFQQQAAEVGFKKAVRDRDEPFGDYGPSTFKG